MHATVHLQHHSAKSIPQGLLMFASICRPSALAATHVYTAVPPRAGFVDCTSFGVPSLTVIITGCLAAGCSMSSSRTS